MTEKRREKSGDRRLQELAKSSRGRKKATRRGNGWERILQLKKLNTLDKLKCLECAEKVVEIAGLNTFTASVTNLVTL